MPENAKESSLPVDVQIIHQLVKMMKRYDLTAIDLGDGSSKIRLRRRGAEGFASQASSDPARAAIATGTTASLPPGQAPDPIVSNDLVIESPMVGTYYASASPDSPPFVNVGSLVRPDLTVCVIEAMKVFTDIPAGLSGTITEVLVKSGQPVEFGQPLFRVRPA